MRKVAFRVTRGVASPKAQLGDPSLFAEPPVSVSCVLMCSVPVPIIAGSQMSFPLAPLWLPGAGGKSHQVGPSRGAGAPGLLSRGASPRCNRGRLCLPSS